MAGPPPRNILDVWHCAPEPRKTASCLPRDEILERCSDEGALVHDAGELLRILQQFIVEGDRCAHLASFLRIEYRIK